MQLCGFSLNSREKITDRLNLHRPLLRHIMTVTLSASTHTPYCENLKSTLSLNSHASTYKRKEIKKILCTIL